MAEDYPPEVGDVRDNHRFDEAGLEAWLSRNVDGFRGPMGVRQFRGGASNPTFLIDAVFEQEEFLKGLTGRGWTIERPFQRMRFGDAGARPSELPFAVAGPEYG